MYVRSRIRPRLPPPARRVRAPPHARTHACFASPLMGACRVPGVARAYHVDDGNRHQDCDHIRTPRHPPRRPAPYAPRGVAAPALAPPCESFMTAVCPFRWWPRGWGGPFICTAIAAVQGAVLPGGESFVKNSSKAHHLYLEYAHSLTGSGSFYTITRVWARGAQGFAGIAMPPDGAHKQNAMHEGNASCNTQRLPVWCSAASRCVGKQRARS